MLCTRVVSVVNITAALPTQMKFPESCKPSSDTGSPREHLSTLLYSTTPVRNFIATDSVQLRFGGWFYKALHVGFARSLGLWGWVSTLRTVPFSRQSLDSLSIS